MGTLRIKLQLLLLQGLACTTTTPTPLEPPLEDPRSPTETEVLCLTRLGTCSGWTTATLCLSATPAKCPSTLNLCSGRTKELGRARWVEEGEPGTTATLNRTSVTSPFPTNQSAASSNECAREGNTCRCSGVVYFGPRYSSSMSAKIYAVAASSGSVSCSSGADQSFPDVLHGASKRCYCHRGATLMDVSYLPEPRVPFVRAIPNFSHQQWKIPREHVLAQTWSKSQIPKHCSRRTPNERRCGQPPNS